MVEPLDRTAGVERAILILVWVILGAASAGAGWLALLTLAAAAGFARARKAARTRPPAEPRKRFLLLVPAHNESPHIGRVLADLRASLAWPEDKCEIVVVADNCADDTADLARPHATVLERRNPDARGKGAALAWASERLAEWPRPFDAVVIIDADTRVNPGFLGALQTTLEEGGSPLVQSVNLVGNPEDGWRPALVYLGFAAMNGVRPAGRDTLGCSAGLMGTGMCYDAPFYLARRYESGGLAEDLEEGMRYRLEGLRTRFCYGAEVRSPMPAVAANAGTQRERWEGGRRAVVRAWWPKMFKAWLRKPNRIVFDGFMELAIPPLGQFGAFLLAVGAACAAGAHWGGWTGLWGPSAWAGILFLSLVGHLAMGLVLTRAPASVYGRALAAPLYIAWKIAYRLTHRRTKTEWVRTEREGQP